MEYPVPGSGSSFKSSSGITMTLDSWDKDIAAVTINNESGGEWSCGEFYELQVLIDGVWYEIPAMPGNWDLTAWGFIYRTEANRA